MKNFWLLFLFPILGYSQISDRPNVILFMADDMGMGDSSAYQFYTKNSDDQQVHTPAMQRLANMGMLFTDAHTPSSRCTPTRYGLLTGRYPWRARMKHWVLFGVQGDPLIEEDRPTLASLFRSQGYATAMVGKWHLGLRYTQSNGKPAAGWEDADLSKGVFDGPCDHGFDYARFTSRSHGTSGPDSGLTGPRTGKNKNGNSNTPDQYNIAFCSCSNHPAGYFNAYQEMAKNEDIDLVLHLGDYIYEYDKDGYATEDSKRFNRVVDPKHEIVSLNDYRKRHAQYKSDLDLQALHKSKPMIAVWDDHEVSNDSWKDGAENHSPDEGSFSKRKEYAIQAYFEWMPIREKNNRKHISETM